MSKRPKRERRDLKKIKTLQKNSTVLLFRENPFFFHLFHRLKDTRRKEKEKRERERDRERDTQNWGEREGCARETTTTTREENVSGPKLLFIIIIY